MTHTYPWCSIKVILIAIFLMKLFIISHKVHVEHGRKSRVEIYMYSIDNATQYTRMVCNHVTTVRIDLA